MSGKLEFTGERFTPECEREIRYEHLHRYAFAATLCQASEVLDAACGEGYGSAILAREARRVVGIDLGEAAIEHARQRYGGLHNVTFEIADCTRLPFEDQSFDRVVSFETLEHLADQNGMLAEFRRVLRPRGLLILSSPDKAVYSDQQGFANEFHVRELYRHELEALLGAHFPHYRLLGQKLAFHSMIWPLEELDKVVLQQAGESGIVEPGGITAAPVYFVALCATEQSALPSNPGTLWLFDDATESVYRHYQGEIRRNMAAGGIIAERDQEIDDLKRKSRKGWLRRLLSRG